MIVLKLDNDNKKAIVVHGYAMSGTNLKSHIHYAAYVLTNFNIVAVVGDYNGGVQFINSCNESSIFKEAKIKLGVIDADVDNHQEYQKGIKSLKQQYNKETRNYVILRKPSSQWIRYANERLQASFDHKRIIFAGAAMDEDYYQQKKANIPVDKLKFINNYEEKDNKAKVIDLLEHQRDIMSTIKVQCALIQVSTSAQGTQSFDLPANLKKQRGASKARKDLYSTLVLGNWMVPVYYDIINYKDDRPESTFTPMFIT